MQLITWLEDRIAQPDDDEFMRRQKAFSFIPAGATVVMASTWAAIFFAAGLRPVALLYLAYSALCLVVVIGALRLPRRALFFGTTMSLAGIVFNLLAHLVSGGFDSGLWYLLWVIILPLAAYLSGGYRGLSLVVLAVALASLGVALAAEARLAPPWPVPFWLLILYNGFVTVIATVMLFLWGVYILQELNAARRRADDLLLNILPAPIAAQLKRNPGVIAQSYDAVTVLFADIVGFTPLSAAADPVVVVNFLNDLFSDFDDLAARHGLEKIKTIGDAYMVVGGLPMPRPDHCQAVAAFAVEMLAAVQRRPAWNGEHIRLRIGINTGPVVAGVIGREKFIYDLWGDTVNTASRMEAFGQAGVIQVTQAVRDCLAGGYAFEPQPPAYIKGKGEMTTYFLRVSMPA